MNTEKKQKQSASFFHELGSFMKPYKNKYIISVVLSILGVLINLISYAFVGIIISIIFSQAIYLKNILFCLVLVVLCKLLYAVLVNTSTWISHRATYYTLKDIRNALTAKMIKMPMGYFEEHGSGRLKTMLVDNIESMEKTLAHLLPEMTANLLAPFALMLCMFFIDWRLALCTLVWIIIGFSVTFGMMKNYEEKYNGQISAMKRMNQAIVEYVGGIEVIKNFGRIGECYKKYEDAVYGHAKYNINWQKETQIYSSLGMSIAPFSLFPVLIMGLILYGNNTLQAGTLFIILLLSLGIFNPLMQAMGYFDQMAQMGTNAQEIKTVLEYPEINRGDCEEMLNTDIEFNNVTFSYAKNKEPVLKNISFKLSAGTMLALVGPSGSGKSTIAKLLAGYWNIGSGEIFIGEKPLSCYSQEFLNKQIAYVEQETFLFDDTIMNNIRMGKPTATDMEVMEAAKKVGCHDFIDVLPNKYQTIVGAAGGRLSGGERQRIAIARAMMKDSPIMILDEATASSDPENEASIQSALSVAAKNKTLIVVAHRLSTIINADQIAFVKDGEITAIGTHSQLLETCSDYADMWTLAEEV